MKLLSGRALASLGLASALVLGSSLFIDADAHPKKRSKHRHHKYEYDANYDTVYRNRNYPVYRRVRDDDRFYGDRPYRVYPRSRNYRQFRMVRSLPRNCQRRVISGREFYYDDYDRNYYRYSSVDNAYLVIDAASLTRDFIDRFF